MLLLLTPLVSAHFWNYNKQGQDWPALCQTSKVQSPINIITANTIQADDDDPHFKELSMEHTYSTISGQFTESLYKITPTSNDLATLYFPVGPIGIPYSGQWIDIHAPSEHQIDGVQYKLEVQIYFFSGFLQTYIVLSLLYDTGDHNDFVQTLIDASEQEQLISIGMAVDYINTYGNYYGYIGSFTQPECYEKIIWTVYPEVKTIGEEQLQFFVSRWAGNPKFAGGNGNNRIVQDLNFRDVTYMEGENEIELPSFGNWIWLGLGLMLMFV